MSAEKKLKYGMAVIYYNPEDSVLEKMKIYEQLFDYICVIDNSEIVNEKVIDIIRKKRKIEYVKMYGNEGMSKALNLAYEWANERNIDFLLTMDQDSYYSKENISKMIEYIDSDTRSNVGIYVANFAKIYWNKDYTKKILGKYCIDDAHIKEVNMCLTSSSFVNVQAIKQILPLEDYFIGYVDNFISTELKIKGYKLIRVGFSKFEQQVGEPVRYSFGVDKLRILHHKPIRYYYMIRNNYYYQKRFCQYKDVVKQSRILRLRLLFNIIVGEKNKYKKLKACKIGYEDYKSNILGKIPDKSLKRIE